MRIDSQEIAGGGRSHRILNMGATEWVPLSVTDTLRMFNVEETGTAYTVRLLAGMAVRGEDYVGLLIDGSDPENLVISYDPDDSIDLTLAIGVNYITLTWGSEDTPTHVTPGVSATPGVEDDGTVMPVAQVTVDVSGNVTHIEQMHRGVWWNDAGYMAPDNSSLSLNSSGQLQDFAWESPTNIGSVHEYEDMLMFWCANPEGAYTKKYYCQIGALGSLFAALVEGYWAESGYPEIPKYHHNLDDLAAGDGVDDHDGTLIDGNFPYVSGRRTSTGQESNSFATGSGLFDHTALPSIDVDGRALWNGLDVTVDWANCYLQYQIPDVGFALSLDWAAHELFGTWTQADTDGQLIVLGEGAATGAEGGALSVAGGIDIGDNLWVLGDGTIEGDLGLTETTSHLIIEGTEDAFDGDFDTGALQVAGGMSMYGFAQILGGVGTSSLQIDSPENKWTPTDLTVFSKAATWKRLADLGPDQYVLAGD